MYVNALLRAIFFSTKYTKFKETNIYYVSMPSFGLLLFLYPTTFLFELMGQSVNALLRASSFSTLIDICINRYEGKKVVDNYINVSIPFSGSLPFLLLPSNPL